MPLLTGSGWAVVVAGSGEGGPLVYQRSKGRHEEEEDEGEEDRRMCRGLINLMIMATTDTVRQRSYQGLLRCIPLYQLTSRYHLLHHILRDCPYPSIKGLLLSLGQKSVAASWSSHSSSPFTSPPHLRALYEPEIQAACQSTTSVQQLLHSIDATMSALNLLRFLLLKRLPQVRTNNPSALPPIHVSFSSFGNADHWQCSAH